MNSPGKSPTFIVRTVGCKVNQYESQAMREALMSAGFREVTDGEKSDFYVINSCTVTHKADRDTRSLIRRFNKTNPDGKIIVAGCYAEMEKDRELLKGMPGVSALVRNSEKEKIAEILSLSGGVSDGAPYASSPGKRESIGGQILDPRFSRRHYVWRGPAIPKATAGRGDDRSITGFTGRDRAFVKVQDGCNHRCSYCKVSLVRGPSKSRCAEGVLKEIKNLVSSHFKEIVFTGVCLGAWGKDFQKKESLAGLLEEAVRVAGDFRIRLSSIEPGYVSDELIRAVKSQPKICKHLHIPLQAGDDRVLGLMNRPYTGKKFLRLIEKIRRAVPDIALTADVMAGFPGEGERNFINTFDVIRKIRPSRVHVFPYSKRDGTRAADYKGEPDKKEKSARVRKLIELGKGFSREFAESFIGKTEFALIESERDKTTGLLTGYTDRYIRVHMDGADSLKNTLTPVTITSVAPDSGLVLARLPAA